MLEIVLLVALIAGPMHGPLVWDFLGLFRPLAPNPEGRSQPTDDQGGYPVPASVIADIMEEIPA